MLSSILERLAFLYFYAANFDDYIIDCKELRSIKGFLGEWEKQDFDFNSNYFLVSRDRFSSFRKSNNPRSYLFENIDFLSLHLSEENKVSLVIDLKSFNAKTSLDKTLDEFLTDYWGLDSEIDNEDGSKSLHAGHFSHWFRLKRESHATQLFREAFQVNALLPFIHRTESHMSDVGHEVYQSHAYLSDEIFSPRLEKLLNEVCDTLSIENNFSLFIENEPIHSAGILPTFRNDNRSIITLSSKLVNELDDGELKFVIGHEIAHWLFNNNDITYICNHTFCSDSGYPSLSFEYLYATWRKLSEISADRIGLLVCGSLEVAVRSLYRVHCDLSPSKVELNIDDFLKDINQRDFSNEFNSFGSHSHPPFYLRVKALSLFGSSRSFQKWSQGDTEWSYDEELSQKMDSIIDLIDYVDEDLNHFKILQAIGLGGVLLAGIDDHIDEGELDWLHNVMLSYVLNPGPVIDYINEFLEHNESDPYEVFFDLLLQLSGQDDETKLSLLQSFLEIALSDGALKTSETLLLLDIGAALGMDSLDVYNEITGTLGKRNFLEKKVMGRFDALLNRSNPFFSGNREEKLLIASDSSTDIDDLTRLGRDLDPHVRVAVLMNESTPIDLKMELMDSVPQKYLEDQEHN